MICGTHLGGGEGGGGHVTTGFVLSRILTKSICMKEQDLRKKYRYEIRCACKSHLLLLRDNTPLCNISDLIRLIAEHAHSIPK